MSPLEWGGGVPLREGKQKLPRFPNSTPESPGSTTAQPPLSSYRFKSSPFKELISDLSSLIFWDSKIQLVDVVA